MEDIVKQFDNKHISKAPAFFDIKKMMWISNEYFKKEHDRGFINFVKPFLTFDVKHFGDKLNDVLLIFKPQISYATQINDLVNQTFLSTDFKKTSQETKTYLKTPNFQKCLDALTEELNNTKDITIDSATQIIENIKTKTGLKGRDLFFPIRFVAIGKEHGPEMNKILHIVGRDAILKNIKILKSI
jgi:glutamyl/glutaminyl-tRNA synthetase